MKRILQSAAFVLIAVLTITACNKDSDKNDTSGNDPRNRVTESYSLYLEKINFIGVEHNNCMEYVYTAFNELNESHWLPGSQEELNEKARDLTIEYFARLDMDLSDYAGIEPGDEIPYSSFSQDGQAILVELEEAAVNYSEDRISAAQFVDRCNELKTDAYALDLSDEAWQIGYGIAVAEHSFQYWAANYGKWFSTSGHGKMSEGQTKVAKADVGGAIWGAVDAAPSGPGMILGAAFGACSMSLVAAIQHKGGFDWWFV